MKAIIYILGAAVVAAGVIYGMSTLGVPQVWLVVAGLIIGGLGLMGAAKSTGGKTTVSKSHTDSAGNTSHTESAVQTDAV